MNKLEEVVKKLQSNNIEVVISTRGEQYLRCVDINKLKLLNFIITKCRDNSILIPLKKVYEILIESNNTDDYFSFMWNTQYPYKINISDLINQAFTWERTKEGHLYWNDVYESLQGHYDLFDIILNLNNIAYPDE